MTPELLSDAERHWKEIDRIGKFSSHFNVFPPKVTARVIRGMEKLSQDIRSFDKPVSKDELHESELKRRLASQVSYLDHFLTGKSFTYDEIIGVLGLIPEDITRLGTWLEQHKDNTIEAIERKFETALEGDHRDYVDLNDPDVERAAEGIARNQITQYHTHLGKMISDLTMAGDYLRDVRAVPTKNPRSEFKFRARKLAIAMPAICYVIDDDSIHVDERELIRLVGHEGMGHAATRVITETANGIPFFLKEPSHGTIAAEESVTQHYERIVFDDLNQSLDTQKRLKIDHIFPGIYQDELDTRAITEYQRNLQAYAIFVLADKSMGDFRDPDVATRRVELIKRVALAPLYALNAVNSARNRYDQDGNLDFDFAHEIRYSDQSVRHSLGVFEQHGIEYQRNRSRIDLLFLTGYWTPVGFRQNAELEAEKGN